MLATTASDTPSSGPNSSPAASVNAVRGKGKTVTTTWAAKKASGNHGPTDVAQSRSCTAVGNGTSNATATRITIAVAIITSRRRGTWRAVATMAARSARNVLTTGFTSTKSTCGGPLIPSSRPRVAPPTGHVRDGDHLA